MDQNSIKIVLATEEHLLSGTIATQGLRLVEVLNQDDTGFVRPADVQIFRRGGLACVAKAPDAVVRKASIGLAALASEEHEAPQRRLNGYVPKKRFETLMLLMGYEIRGTLYLKSSRDPILTLCHDLGSFFPVAQASLSFAGTQIAQQRTQVIIANREFVSLFRLSEQTTVEESAAGDPPNPAASVPGQPLVSPRTASAVPMVPGLPLTESL